MSTTSNGGGSGRSFSLQNVLLAGIPAVLIVLAVFAWLYNQAQQTAPPVDFLASVQKALQTPTKLSAGLVDVDGDLVADPLSDAAAQLDPDTLVFEVLGSNLEREQEQWADFTKHLETVTGKKVQLILRPETTGVAPANAVAPAVQQARDLRAGKIHLACLNTGAVSLGVNEGGAVPFCVMAGDDGKFGYEMEIIVPAKSTAQKASDLKGSQRVLYTSLYSHSGFKAPLSILWDEFDLQPERDYTPVFTVGQEKAIEEIMAGRGDAAPVASDFLQRTLSRKEAKADAVRSIYKSKSFPPACFAHGHQLKPELAAKVKQAFLDFDWKGSSLEKAYAPAHQTKFVAVAYKDAWQSVREVEEKIAGLLRGKLGFTSSPGADAPRNDRRSANADERERAGNQPHEVSH